MQSISIRLKYFSLLINKLMKQLSLFIISLIVFSCTFNICLTTSFKTNSKIGSSFTNNKAGLTQSEEGENPTLWEGWVKYFHFDSFKSVKRPTEFFINDQFYNQRVPNDELLAKVDGINKNIIDKYSFYATLSPKRISILRRRNDKYEGPIENLDIDIIKPVDPAEPLKGPIKDIGKFNEGSCLTILALLPLTYDKSFLPIREDANTTKNESWIVCFQDDTQKEKFYTSILTYKILRQKEQGIELALRKSDMSKLQPESTPKFERYTGSDAKPGVDGYLQLIQDWSQCTLKCGGGEQFQQWRCIPPKPDGKPCQGELIRKKSCNTNKCPGIEVNSKEGDDSAAAKEEQIDFKPIYRRVPFNPRPQQDIDCVVKENDILYRKEQKDDKGKLRTHFIPGRVVLNQKTIALYDGSTNENLFNFDLDKTELTLIPDEFKCMRFLHINKEFVICGLENTGTKEDPKFLNSWKRSFSLFKTRCYKKKDSEKVAEDTIDEKNKQPEASATLAAMNIESEEAPEREKIINDKLNQQNEVALEDKVLKTQQTALKAITRELNLEERLKREEMMKAKEETKVLIKKMNYESEKKDKLEEAIEERENQENKFLEERKTNNAATQIITETEETINKKRMALKKKILEIRKMTERRKRLIENKINLIRGKMTEKIVEANKTGNTDTCLKTRDGKQSELDTYCDANIITDFSRNLDCKKKENFCYICCETEFGTAQFNNRSNCYDKCDGDKKKVEEEKPAGDWIFKKYS